MSAATMVKRPVLAEEQDHSGPGTPAAGADFSMTRRFLEILGTPAVGCTELRILRGAFDRRGQIQRGDDLGPGQRGATLAGWYHSIELLVSQARRLRGVTGYVTINPVCSDLLARSDGRLARVRHTTRDVDVVCLRWLYLDIDPVRPPDISSTETEVGAAIARRDAILTDHPELARSAFWGCSGNGAWVLVRLPDYPNDPSHRALVAESVRLIASRYSDASVIIDTATVNPARLISLPGTIKAKGSPRPQRPWRFVTLDGIGFRGSTPCPGN
jgi:hypothetical protein